MAEWRWWDVWKYWRMLFVTDVFVAMSTFMSPRGMRLRWYLDFVRFGMVWAR